MIFRFIFLLSFFSITVHGETPILDFNSKWKTKELSPSQAFSFQLPVKNFQFHSDSTLKSDTLRKRKSILSNTGFIVSVSPYNMILVPGCIEGLMSWRPKRVVYFTEASWSRFNRTYLFDNWFYSYSIGLGIGFRGKLKAPKFSISLGLANRKAIKFPNSGFYLNSYFIYGKFVYRIMLIRNRVILGCGFTSSIFLSDPYFNSIYNNDDWGWNMTKLANELYRRQKIILRPFISLGFRVF